MDGAIVMRRDGRLVAMGAIVRGDEAIGEAEGARTTASQAGAVIKVSEDGAVSLFSRGQEVWEL